MILLFCVILLFFMLKVNKYLDSLFTFQLYVNKTDLDWKFSVGGLSLSIYQEQNKQFAAD